MNRNEDLILAVLTSFQCILSLHSFNYVLTFALFISKCKNTTTSGIRTLLLLSSFSHSSNFSHVHSYTGLLSTLILTLQKYYKIAS